MVGEVQDTAVRKKRPVWPWIIAGAVVVIGAAIAIPVSLNIAADNARVAAEQQAAADAAAAEEARLDQFRAQLVECGISAGRADDTTRILDGGESLEMLRVTKFDGPPYFAMECVLEGLGAPASIESEIGQTRALDGRQQDEWDGFTIAWSYHPDDGASVLIKHAG